MSCGRTYDLGGSQRVDPIEIVDRTAAIFRPLAQAERVKELEAALLRLHLAVKALSQFEGRITLFEASPMSSQTAFIAWQELDAAQKDAIAALTAPGDGE